MENILFKEVIAQEYDQLIQFDFDHLISNQSIPKDQAAPRLTLPEINNGRTKNIFWLNLDRQEKIGYVWIEIHERRLFLAALAIKSEFRNRKIGTWILSWMEKRTKSLGLSSCFLAVSPWNSHALYTYLKQGYRVIDCNSNYFADARPGIIRLILEKNIV